MSLSIITNRGATVALQSLNRTNRELDAVQKRVSTGFRVSDAKDDGAAFAVAQGLRAKIKAYDGATERFDSIVGKLRVYDETVKGISDTTAQLGGVIVKLADENLNAEERAAYTKDYTDLKSEIQRYAVQAEKATGVNFLGGAGNFNYFLDDVDGHNLVIQGMYVTHSVYIDANLPWNPTQTDAKNMLADNGGFREHEKLVSNALANIGKNLRSYEHNTDFANIMKDTIQNAIGSMVDADLAKDSARMRALQIRQQLGAQTLGIANQAPSAILQLFQ